MCLWSYFSQDREIYALRPCTVIVCSKNLFPFFLFFPGTAKSALNDIFLLRQNPLQRRVAALSQVLNVG